MELTNVQFRDTILHRYLESLTSRCLQKITKVRIPKLSVTVYFHHLAHR